MTNTELVDRLIHEFQSSPRVLLADDDENFAILFRDTLLPTNCIVDIATDTDTAVDKIQYQSIKCQPFDLIFLDLKMPPKDGVFVLAKAKEYSPHTPVIIVTGFPDSDMVSKAMRHGYLGLLKKPVDFEQLKETFDKHKLSLHEHHSHLG